jgi:hypothetical protein
VRSDSGRARSLQRRPRLFPGGELRHSQWHQFLRTNTHLWPAGRGRWPRPLTRNKSNLNNATVVFLQVMTLLMDCGRTWILVRGLSLAILTILIFRHYRHICKNVLNEYTFCRSELYVTLQKRDGQLANLSALCCLLRTFIVSQSQFQSSFNAVCPSYQLLYKNNKNKFDMQ